MADTDTFLGEVRLFAGDYAPLGWAICDGSLLSLPEHEELFSLIGVTYGGDGSNTFALPDLRGRLAVHQGRGPGMSTEWRLGQIAGTETVRLMEDQSADHDHFFLASRNAATATAPEEGMVLAAMRKSPAGVDRLMYLAPNVTTGFSSLPLDTLVLDPVGGGEPHENLMPSLALTYIIALRGLAPFPN